MFGSFVGGLPFFNDAVSCAANAATQIKGSAGQLFALKLVNTQNATAYLQVFGKAASAVTVGTTAADYVIRLGANESIFMPFPVPLEPSGDSGISIAGTTTATGSTGSAISVLAIYG